MSGKGKSRKNSRSLSEEHKQQSVAMKSGAKIEAMDYLGKWYPARIVKTRKKAGKCEVLVHFDRWNSRFDVWLPDTSEKIRAPKLEKAKQKEWRVGDRVVARWGPAGKTYPATVSKVLNETSVEVVFYDGFKKNLNKSSLKADTEKLYRQYEDTLRKVIMSPTTSSTETSPASATTGTQGRSKRRLTEPPSMADFVTGVPKKKRSRSSDKCNLPATSGKVNESTRSPSPLVDTPPPLLTHEEPVLTKKPEVEIIKKKNKSYMMFPVVEPEESNPAVEVNKTVPSATTKKNLPVKVKSPFLSSSSRDKTKTITENDKQDVEDTKETTEEIDAKKESTLSKDIDVSCKHEAAISVDNVSISTGSIKSVTTPEPITVPSSSTSTIDTLTSSPELLTVPGKRKKKPTLKFKEMQRQRSKSVSGKTPSPTNTPKSNELTKSQVSPKSNNLTNTVTTKSNDKLKLSKMKSINTTKLATAKSNDSIKSMTAKSSKVTESVTPKSNEETKQLMPKSETEVAKPVTTLTLAKSRERRTIKLSQKVREVQEMSQHNSEKKVETPVTMKSSEAAVVKKDFIPTQDPVGEITVNPKPDIVEESKLSSESSSLSTKKKVKLSLKIKDFAAEEQTCEETKSAVTFEDKYEQFKMKWKAEKEKRRKILEEKAQKEAPDKATNSAIPQVDSCKDVIREDVVEKRGEDVNMAKVTSNECSMLAKSDKHSNITQTDQATAHESKHTENKHRPKIKYTPAEKFGKKSKSQSNSTTASSDEIKVNESTEPSKEDEITSLTSKEKPELKLDVPKGKAKGWPKGKPRKKKKVVEDSEYFPEGYVEDTSRTPSLADTISFASMVQEERPSQKSRPMPNYPTATQLVAARIQKRVHQQKIASLSNIDTYKGPTSLQNVPAAVLLPCTTVLIPSTQRFYPQVVTLSTNVTPNSVPQVSDSWQANTPRVVFSVSQPQISTSGNQITLQPSSGNQITQQPSGGNQITQQPSGGNQITLQPSSENRITLQPSSGNPTTLQPSSGNQIMQQPSGGNQITQQQTNKELDMTIVKVSPRKTAVSPLKKKRKSLNFITSRLQYKQRIMEMKHDFNRGKTTNHNPQNIQDINRVQTVNPSIVQHQPPHPSTLSPSITIVPSSSTSRVIRMLPLSDNVPSLSQTHVNHAPSKLFIQPPAFPIPHFAKNVLQSTPQSVILASPVVVSHVVSSIKKSNESSQSNVTKTPDDSKKNDEMKTQDLTTSFKGSTSVGIQKVEDPSTAKKDTLTKNLEKNNVLTIDVKANPNAGNQSKKSKSLTTTPVLAAKEFSVHTPLDEYKCTVRKCNKSFRKQHLLDYHIKYFHTLKPALKRSRTSVSLSSNDSNPASAATTPRETSKRFSLGSDSEYESETESEEEISIDDCVKCVCEDERDTGFMIQEKGTSQDVDAKNQCEQCFTWQHGECVGFSQQKGVPLYYLCHVCARPKGQDRGICDVPQEKGTSQNVDVKNQNDFTWFRHGQLQPLMKDRSPHTLEALIHPDNEEVMNALVLASHAIMKDLLNIKQVLDNVKRTCILAKDVSGQSSQNLSQVPSVSDASSQPVVPEGSQVKPDCNKDNTDKPTHLDAVEKESSDGDIDVVNTDESMETEQTDDPAKENLSSDCSSTADELTRCFKETDLSKASYEELLAHYNLLQEVEKVEDKIAERLEYLNKKYNELENEYTDINKAGHLLEDFKTKYDLPDLSSLLKLLNQLKWTNLAKLTNETKT